MFPKHRLNAEGIKMEIQLQELLERIHSEGSENSKQQAEEIIKKAHSEAAEIVARQKNAERCSLRP